MSTITAYKNHEETCRDASRLQSSSYTSTAMIDACAEDFAYISSFSLSGLVWPTPNGVLG